MYILCLYVPQSPVPHPPPQKTPHLSNSGVKQNCCTILSPKSRHFPKRTFLMTQRHISLCITVHLADAPPPPFPPSSLTIPFVPLFNLEPGSLLESPLCVFYTSLFLACQQKKFQLHKNGRPEYWKCCAFPSLFFLVCILIKSHKPILLNPFCSRLYSFFPHIFGDFPPFPGD